MKLLNLDNTQRLDAAYEVVRRQLLHARTPDGHWTGELSESALSTATAAFALAAIDGARGVPAYRNLIQGGLDWLARHPNADGGWGDTIRSKSNLSTTALAWVALGAVGDSRARHADVLARAEAWIRDKAGGLEPARLSSAIAETYGKDYTFSVPILTTCALAGRLGPAGEAWKLVRQLPFELAALPRAWFKHLGLPVVSYALPALIAVGQARHHHRPSHNPAARLARALVRGPVLKVLEEIQPSSGGFLEAVPLTSFVTMSLAASGWADHPVSRKAAEFLARSARPDGSWPIDTNLATWLTTLSVNALGQGGESPRAFPQGERCAVQDWLLAQQHRQIHPYTGADPGGWAWTDLPGGVPDADDTAGALLALKRLGPVDERTRDAAALGVRWLMGLQNRDGGIPTFCRGWSKLPFDRSGADLTAHALRALSAWRDEVPAASGLDAAVRRGLAYLLAAQGRDGTWKPLWFGNESAPGNENLVYGTARVLIALRELRQGMAGGAEEKERRGTCWLLSSENTDGGWGGTPGVGSSVEETAVAVEALAANGSPEGADALARGTGWLVEHVESGTIVSPSPIGFYFANLWYFEKLYPLIFTVSALGRARQTHRNS